MSRLPTDVKARKNVPLARGLLDYFPDALCEVAELSRIGNEQHSPGQPLHWAKEKSTDEPDALMRHLIDRGTRDTDGVRHSAKVAWRALALLQREIEGELTKETCNPQKGRGVYVNRYGILVPKGCSLPQGRWNDCDCEFWKTIRGFGIIGLGKDWLASPASS